MQEEVIQEIGIILKKEIVKEGIEVIIIETEIIQEIEIIQKIDIGQREIENISEESILQTENLIEGDAIENTLEIETIHITLPIEIGIEDKVKGNPPGIERLVEYKETNNSMD